MILVSTFLIIWMLLGNEHGQWWFVLLEVLVTAVIVVEVVAQMIAYNQDFWDDGWNVLDFIVMILCVGSFVVYAFDVDSGKNGNDVPALVVLGIRYVAQGMRLMSLVRRAQKTQERLKAQAQDVTYEEGDEEDDEDLPLKHKRQTAHELISQAEDDGPLLNQ